MLGLASEEGLELDQATRRRRMRGVSRDIIAPMNSNGAAVRKMIGCFCSLALSTSLATLADAQQSNTAASKNNSTAMATAVQRDAPLVFTEAIPLENAKGRFDHFAMGEGKLFVAALGSNVVEVINIGGRILDHTITGVPDPQGIAFSPETGKLFVASGQGKVYIYDAKSYELIATVDFPGAAETQATALVRERPLAFSTTTQWARASFRLVTTMANTASSTSRAPARP